MKRKALITATAVLLVAVMCLATASYAWFTSGNKSYIQSFNLSVDSGDSAIVLAPAQFSKGTDGADGSYLKADDADWTANLTTDALKSKGSVIPTDALTALSTVGNWDGNAYQLFGSTYSTENLEWTSYAAGASDKYVALTFYAKAPAGTKAKLNVDISKETDTDGQVGKFNSVVKVGYYNETATAQGTATGGNFAVYDLATETGYHGVNAENAVSELVSGSFEPKGQSAGFATEITNKGLFSAADDATVEFGENAELFVIYMWVEGMDDNCTGDFDLSNIKVDVTFSTVA